MKAIAWLRAIAACGVGITTAMMMSSPVLAACLPPPADLQSRWPADGTALDRWGGYNGVLNNGVSFDTGKVGQAFDFDGIDDFVEIANAAALNLGPVSLPSISGSTSTPTRAPAAWSRNGRPSRANTGSRSS